MSFQDEILKIEQNKIAPIYLVLGTEQALQDRFKEAIEEKVAPEDDLNKITIDLTEQPLSDVLNEALSIPFLGDKRLVLAENPWFLTGQSSPNGLPNDVEGLLSYLESPLDSTVLVFFAPYEKLDERKKVVKQLKKVAKIVSATPLTQQEMTTYGKNTFLAAGIKIDSDAFKELLERCGDDFSKLELEIEKLLIYGQTKKRLSVRDVKLLVTQPLQDDVFQLANFLRENKTSEALKLLDDLLLQGEEPIKLNGILISQFRLELQVKILMKNMSQAQMASLLKVHPFRVKKAMEAVRRVTVESLGKLLNDLINQDFNFKQSTMEKKMAFQLFIMSQGK